MRFVSRRRRWSRVPVVLVLVLVLAGPLPAAPASAADDPQAPSRSIIIEPNSGSEPENFGDRGGAGQTLLFFLIITAVAGGAIHIARHARRSQAALEASDESAPA